VSDRGPVRLAPSILAADLLVAGSSVFGDRDGVAAAMKRLRAAIDDTQDEPELARPSTSQRSR
jgi:hypothetical protein